MSIRFERDPAKNDANQRKHGLRFDGSRAMTDVPDIPEWTKADFKSSIRGSTRRRIMEGRIESGKDIVALRRFTKLSQKEFARALEISVHTLRNWEQGRRQPEGPAIALLKIAARHPNIVRRAAGRDPSAARSTSR